MESLKGVLGAKGEDTSPRPHLREASGGWAWQTDQESPSFGPKPFILSADGQTMKVILLLRQSRAADERGGELDHLVTGSHSDRNPNAASPSQRLTSQLMICMLFLFSVNQSWSSLPPPSLHAFALARRVRRGQNQALEKRVLS